jgi:hypothetical protein
VYQGTGLCAEVSMVVTRKRCDTWRLALRGRPTRSINTSDKWSLVASGLSRGAGGSGGGPGHGPCGTASHAGGHDTRLRARVCACMREKEREK